MFTGIISHLGKLQKKEKTIFTFQTDPALISKLELGTSVAVNGVCLTVREEASGDSFSVEVMPETEKKTNIEFLEEGSLVNLELPATADTFLSGHIVQGHVDGVGKIQSIEEDGNSHVFRFSIPESLSRYMVEKGSVTVNGISLTIIEAGKDFFTVGIIPHTWEMTMLHTTKENDTVNIEVDVLAKYIERLLKNK